MSLCVICGQKCSGPAPVSSCALRQQELGQRSGDCLPGNTHWAVEDQLVCARRSALQSVSGAARRFSNHYLQREAAPWLCLMNLIHCSSLQLHSVCVLRDFLTAEDKEGVFNADHFPLWYKRAAEQVPGTFIYSIPFSAGKQNKCSDYSVKCAHCAASDINNTRHEFIFLLLLYYLHLC